MTSHSRPSPRAALVVILAVHPASVGATRLRAVQFAPSLEAAGLECRLWSFLSEDDLADWFSESHARRVRAVLHGLRRLGLAVRLIRRAAVVVVQREAVPFGPPMLEALARRRAVLIWDVDDAIWERFDSPTAGRVPGWIRGTGGKYAWLARRADEVWAASEVLARWCRRHGGRVRVVPPASIVPAEPTSAEGRVVGWIGSHSTQPFLEEILPSLAAINPPPTVLVVGAQVADHPPLRIECVAWSPQAEEDALRRIRVGLYPIDRRHPLAEGKGCFKSVLYMSHGIPCVVTPTETNTTLVRHGIEGLHANTSTDWTHMVQLLLDDEDLWRRSGAHAHTRARGTFSVEQWGPWMSAAIQRLLESQTIPRNV